MTDRLQTLLATADQSEKLELTMANNGLITAMRGYNDRPGKQTKEDYEAARQLFDDVKERLTAKYFPEEAPAPEGERFKNRKQAHNWLAAQGYKVSNGKFYNDCEAGFPAIHKDGSVSRYQVMQYAQQQDVERRGSVFQPGGGDDDARKLKAQADQEEMKAERMRREQDEQWLHADAAWSALAALLGVLKDSLLHHFHASQGELVHLAGGDPSRGPEIYEACDEIAARAFNEVAASGNIDGIFSKEE